MKLSTKMALRNNFLRKIEVYLRILSKKNKYRERNILRTITFGKGADIGCGSNKVNSNCIGVDLFGKQERGIAGCEKGKSSVADYKSAGDNLSMFKNNELDFIVAKHNLEHYDSPLKTLLEWKRVIKKGGKIGVVVPDDRYVNSSNLDPTHRYSFSPKTLHYLFKHAGLKIIKEGIAIKHWSIYLIAEK